MRETQNASFYFRGLECSGCQQVVGGGLEQKVLFGAGWNLYLVKFKDRGRRLSCYCFG